MRAHSLNSGSILPAKVVTPAPYLAAAMLLIVTVLLAFILACTIRYPKTTRAKGFLAPESASRTLTSPLTGVVGIISVRDSHDVATGDLLLEVYAPTTDGKGRDVNVALEAAAAVEMSAIEIKAKSETERLSSATATLISLRAALTDELRSLDREILSRSEQARIAKATEARYETLSRDQIVSVIQLDQQRIAVLESKGYVEALTRQRSSIQRQIIESDRSLRELRLEISSISLNANVSVQKLLGDEATATAKRRQQLIATSPGRVSSVLVKQGEAVSHGQPLMEISPNDGIFEGVILVPSSKLESVAVGNDVDIKITAYPSHKYGILRSKIAYLSSVAMPSEEVQRYALEAEPGERFFKVLVQFGPEHDNVQLFERLLSGMTFEASIHSDERTLFEWILDPLLSKVGDI